MESVSEFGGEVDAQNIKNIINQYAPVRSMSIASNSSLSHLGRINPKLSSEISRASAMNEMSREK